MRSRPPIVFEDIKKRAFTLKSMKDIQKIGYAVAELVVQKNRMNGQKVRLVKHSKYIEIYPIRAVRGGQDLSLFHQTRSGC